MVAVAVIRCLARLLLLLVVLVGMLPSQKQLWSLAQMAVRVAVVVVDTVVLLVHQQEIVLVPLVALAIRHLFHLHRATMVVQVELVAPHQHLLVAVCLV